MRYRFGDFVLDAHTQELTRGGQAVALSGKPMLLLIALVERPGELLTRAELRDRLWAGDTFVDFDGNLNAAARRLRSALGDSAGEPRWVETLAGRGYRFVGELLLDEPLPPPARARAPGRRGVRLALAVLIALAGLSSLSMILPGRASRVRLAVAPVKALDGATTLSAMLTEELIGQLGALDGERLEVFGSSAGSEAVAKADYVLEGSVSAQGDRVRVLTRLVTVRRGTIVWSEMFECSIGHLFAIERKIAQRVRRSVGAGDRTTGERARPSELDPAAAHGYLAGSEHLRRGRTDAALRELAAAVRAEPAFALAHARLARARLAARQFGAARQSAYAALRIDFTLAEAHRVLGLVELEERHDVAAAERSLRRALDLDGGDAGTRTALDRVAALSRESGNERQR